MVAIVRVYYDGASGSVNINPVCSHYTLVGSVEWISLGGGGT
jgi:hypothetical protein